MRRSYEVIIIGAGSIGVAIAMALGEAGVREVAVIEQHAAPGQGQNNRAIGGIRAAHTNLGKVITCLESIRVFSEWKELHGEDIGWEKGGYLFPAYDTALADHLKRNVKKIRSIGVDIDWLNTGETAGIADKINTAGLRGTAFSPNDGRASPIRAITSFYRYAVSLGVRFIFKERVKGITVSHQCVRSVISNRGEYFTHWVVNAAGISAHNVGTMVGIQLPVYPSFHVAGKTEPSVRFLKPLVVDLRSDQECDNFYLFQNNRGEFVFTISPKRKTGVGEAVDFIFQKRMGLLFSHLKRLRVVRKWGGAYPMTPDGVPIVGAVDAVSGCINAVGMCGQGFMSGPGIGGLVARIITDNLGEKDSRALKSFNMNRQFTGGELLK
jgi:sarcosine oxidase subunit beta